MALPQQVVEQLNQGTRRTPGWSSGMLLFSGSVLVVVIVIYAGLQFGYTPYLNGQVSSLESQAQKLGQSVSVTDQANLVTFYSQDQSSPVAHTESHFLFEIPDMV